MQNPDEDTDWNAALRAKGILPQKPKEKEITEEEIVDLVEKTLQDKQSNEKKLESLTLDELDDLEDEEDERVLLEYRNKRIAEMKAEMEKGKFGDVREISAQDYVQEVNKAGEGIWVVLHLYKQGIPLCTLLNQYLDHLARKFPATKFLRSVSSVCIPNYPDKNLPTMFVYFESEMKSQLVGPHEFRGMNLKIEELEWILAQTGAFKTTLEDDPRPKVKDVMFAKLRGGAADDVDDGGDENDW